MKTIRKIIIFSLIAFVILFGVAAGYIWLKNEQTQKLNAVNTELEDYKAIYEPLGEIVTGYAVVNDERYGKKITEYDLTQVDITENCSYNMVPDIDELVGKYYRTNITAGTVLSYDMVMEFEQTSDERAFDVITKFNPIGLEPNDFVDIRFSMPNGEDYIALSHKRVEGVYSGVLKLVMNEFDIMVYNSMIVDQILFKGSIIYATKYLEPGGQEAATTNYPISNDVLTVLYNDPNAIKREIPEELWKNREIMERSYEQYAEDEIRKSQIESGKSDIPSIIQNGESDYRTQKEIEEQKRLEEAIMNGGY